jgi:proton-translocating NADH-quinone oxidoreductase chain N
MPTFVALPLLAAPLAYFTGRLSPWRWLSAYLVSLIALGTTWVAFLAGAGEDHAMQIDGLSRFITVLALGFGTLVAIYARPDMVGENGVEKLYAMLLVSIGAVLGLVCAADLFNLWIWFELLAVTSYLLVIFYRERALALAAGIKYLIQTAIGSALVLFAIALVLTQTQSLELQTVQLPPTTLLAVIGTFFLFGFGVKTAIIPTYTWLPDAYAQAPSSISAFMSAIITVTGLIALLRVLALLSVTLASWGTVLIVIGLLNIVVGNVLALPQTEVKRLLAYSSISHMGYLLLAFGIGLYTGQIATVQAGLFHLFNHGVMKALAFMAVGVFIYALQRQHRDPEAGLTIANLTGAAQCYPFMSFCLTLALLSLAGIPPLAGFMSKWQIFAGGVTSGQGLLIGAVLFAAANSVFSLAYYLPVINALFRRVDHPRGVPVPRAMQLPIGILAALVIIPGIWPGMVSGLIEPASRAIMQIFGA